MIIQMKWETKSHAAPGRLASLLFTIKWQGGEDSVNCTDSNVPTILNCATNIFVNNKLPINRYMAAVILSIYNGYRLKGYEFSHILFPEFKPLINEKCLIREYYRQYAERYSYS